MGLLTWAVLFLVVAIVAGFFGFGNVARESAGIARILFGLFLVIFLVFLVLGLLG